MHDYQFFFALSSRLIASAKQMADPARRYAPRLAAVCAISFLMLASLGISACAADELHSGSQTIALKFDGRTRSYIAHLPALADHRAALPVVLNFHGGGSDAEIAERYTGMDQAADRDGFIVVYPNGTGFFSRMLTWNAGGCCAYAMRNQIDDVGFTRAVIDDLARRTSIDQHRVYATGISNGGMMAYRLGVELSDRIAAIAPVEAVLLLDSGAPSRPVPLMAFNSADDRFVPYGGGFGVNGNRAHPSPYPAIDTVIARWREYDRCADTPRVSATLRGEAGSPDAANSATRYTWGPCAQDTEVVLWKLTGSGHVWPGSARNPRWLLGPGTNVIDANQQMWEFFKRYSLPHR
jgi:polyhydroxybutyrate depolymerase